MALALVTTHSLIGLSAQEVSVEVQLANGLPGFHLVGLPQAEVRESRDRVRAALLESGFDFPNRRITVSLAPADLPKTGGWFDLPIALGILLACEVLPAKLLAGISCIGELSLSGAIKPMQGAVALGLAMQSEPKAQLRAVICPLPNVSEFALTGELRLLGAAHLRGLIEQLKAGALPQLSSDLHPNVELPSNTIDVPCLSSVRGQTQAKLAIEIAAAGAHSALLVGPPGSGKTMLASAMYGLLPPMPLAQARESAAVLSLVDAFNPANFGQRPWRQPHHNSSTAALVGGGGQPRPGELSLAHHGVLFLDELPEFSRQALDAMRQPLESGRVDIVRAAYRVRYPARTQLIAAMNPCICGYWGSPRCRCSSEAVQRYQAHVSGPLLDRIDIQLAVKSVPHEQMLANQATTPASETTAQVRLRVLQAVSHQQKRQGKPNAMLNATETQELCDPGAEGRQLLARAFERFQWSARSLHRVMRIARTIADLASDQAQGPIQVKHLAQALELRRGLVQRAAFTN